MKGRCLIFQGTRVWVPDPDNVWIGAELLEDLKDDQLELGLEDGRVNKSTARDILCLDLGTIKDT